MPFSTLEKRQEYNKKYLEKNRDKINEARRNKYHNDPEYKNKCKERDKKYYDKVRKNPEYQKNYYEKNKDRDKEYKKKYEINIRIERWKRNGIKFTEDPLIIESKWKETKKCELCNIDLTNKKKCLDHDHLSGHIRGFVCRSCNSKMARYDNLRIRLCLDLHRYFHSK